ncbi:CusA/CzcA family heavy metal efflux RND transporter [Candidatus Sulfidibacterium hydrothermale]|uniref:CusA/CzcA family heavy metal efflux RND transporter n=1 Tax=Candidatus Sulfidibacterium hydrothermale TaxID=2875962 RepID=UPI001F0A8B91|nr:CusA/CzcA family heavy metal efflux RND transporter [Candidatus Sulfidibacterium hydrothermale]UBM63093.1 CusA/CzcA family heavy metal efflux RND transporter [Candidatus Sulfidibacterium hydrothermale]
MLEKIIQFSLKNKLIVILFTLTVVGFGLFAISQIPIGAVPDITNNQVQVITTSRDLATQDVEQFITYPIELELSNVPGVKEIRSVSKFGLSVVTVVFDDAMGTYLPRLLISEKLKNAEEKIPKKFGTPQLGPITTGLGEIYQYILDTKPGYDTLYSVQELRTIQDWIVKRQLAGIPGVVEINTWGGYLKQYEVAVDPQKLRAMNTTIVEVFDALEKNNAIAGGSYIEKGAQSYFIRADGLAKSLKDIGNIVVKNVNGVPVLIKDVAQVKLGHANRFGAITGNGQGEKVMGQIMMLKGANSKKVIEAVKKRIAKVQKNLPEGVYINPFLERSELVNKTTFTVAENLILGFIIVLGVVILLLGNLRSGLLIASVIPLALLFTLSLMYIFGVDANLMSLGAIDFGIIIDGSVIIVEFISLQILRKWDTLKMMPKENRQKEIDEITFKSTNKMMHSAVFGQLIILIVFIPVLTLTGVEGKMFRPMALTFSFALLGAMLFGFTYVPVAASLFLKPAKNPKNFSFRMIEWLKGLYIPSIKFALKHKALVLSVSAVLLIISVITFGRMGGEFVPTLDEGDFVIQPILKTGTSLSKTIETTTRIERILLKQFPNEVDQVVSRIGAAEVPTDPMSMEDADIIIKLKDKKNWTKAHTKDELANEFKKALEVIPGVGYEFTQPIEMRFNELITGVRADIAVKIYGEDLAILNQKAKEARNLIEGIPGAADISVEKVEGLPQISIKYDRQKLAKFGMNVDELDKIVSLAFAGVKAGVIFTGEKNFDLVVRYQNDFKKNIENVKDLRVKLPSGNSIPFTELADITYTEGPAKISRDNTKRRIVVGINVRDRDLESVVKDIQKKLGANLHLPSGYYIEYGGQFENLRTAKKRLTIAIPVALLLIFILLHFAFQSIKEAIMVYTAIPLSAVGGVFLLWLRDMPFSISAGVGFIALFGIAVLNGIVLIEHYKSLKAQGMTNVDERIIKGSSERLRPVLLTAAAAALGFFPMAFSHNVGAEVQRPLATVVIGGLFTATLLTMIVLPVLYSIFDKPLKIKKMKKPAGTVMLIILMLGIFYPSSGYSQSQPEGLKLSAAIDSALIHNQNFQSAVSMTKERKAMIGTAVDFGKTDIYYSVDENNQAEQGLPLHVMGVQQTFAYPGVYSARKKALKKSYEAGQAALNISKNRLKKEVSSVYYLIVYYQNKLEAYRFLDSLYTRFSTAAGKKLKAGEGNYLEKLTAMSKKQEIHTRRLQIEKELEIAYQELYKLMGVQPSARITITKMEPLPYRDQSLSTNPFLLKLQKEREATLYLHKTENRKLVPDLKLEYFTGKTTVADAKWYQGFTVGLAIPLWFGPQKSRAKATGLMYQAVQQKEVYQQKALETKKKQLKQKLEKYLEAIRYYQENGKKLSRTLLRTADKSFMAGEINYFQFIQSMKAATDIRLNYLDNLQQYNQTVLELQYIEL